MKYDPNVSRKELPNGLNLLRKAKKNMVALFTLRLLFRCFQFATAYGTSPGMVRMLRRAGDAACSLGPICISRHTAFCSKPEIPTYLIGAVEELKEFHKLVPAPNEAYSNLFWPGETNALDAFIAKKNKEEQEARKKRRRVQTQSFVTLRLSHGATKWQN